MSGRQNKSGFAAVNRKQTSASSSEADELTDAINELRRLKDTHDAACADSAAKACASVSQLQAAEERRASAQEQHFVPLLVKLKSIKATLKDMNRMEVDLHESFKKQRIEQAHAIAESAKLVIGKLVVPSSLAEDSGSDFELDLEASIGKASAAVDCGA